MICDWYTVRDNDNDSDVIVHCFGEGTYLECKVTNTYLIPYIGTIYHHSEQSKWEFLHDLSKRMKSGTDGMDDSDYIEVKKMWLLIL